MEKQESKEWTGKTDTVYRKLMGFFLLAILLMMAATVAISLNFWPWFH